MSYNGSGTFVVNSSGQPVVTATVISSTVFNALTSDLATGLSTAICKDGQTACTARIPFALGINSSLVTDATSIGTGSIITAGGIGVTKALWVGGLANIAGAVTLQSTLAVTGHVTAEGVTSTGATGTGKLVFDTTPTLVTPVLGAATGTSVALGTNPATSGLFRGANSKSVVTGRNAANGANANLLGISDKNLTALNGLTITVANNGTSDLSADASLIGFLIVTEIGADNKSAIVQIGGGSGVTDILLQDSFAEFSATAANPGTTNIYWQADHYELENKRGGSRTYRLLMLGDF